PFVIPEEIDFKGKARRFAYLGAIANPEATLLTYNADVNEYNYTNNGTYLPIAIQLPPVRVTYNLEGPFVTSGIRHLNYGRSIGIPFDENDNPIPTDIKFGFFITDPTIRKGNWLVTAVYHSGKNKKLTKKSFYLGNGGSLNIVLKGITIGDTFPDNKILFYFTKKDGPSFAALFYLEKLQVPFLIALPPKAPIEATVSSKEVWGDTAEAEIIFSAVSGGYASSSTSNTYKCKTRFFVAETNDSSFNNPVAQVDSQPAPAATLINAYEILNLKVNHPYLIGAQTVCPGGYKSSITQGSKYLVIKGDNNLCTSTGAEKPKIASAALEGNKALVSVDYTKCNGKVGLEVRLIGKECPNPYSSKGKYTFKTINTPFKTAKPEGNQFSIDLDPYGFYDKVYILVRAVSEDGNSSYWRYLGNLNGVCPDTSSYPSSGKYGFAPY
ncbi:MAG: hypothetical protein D6780_00915, partial [Candidatus Dadabacteria bacterium]